MKRTSFRQNAVAEVGTHQFQQNGCREGKRRWVWVTCSAKCPARLPEKHQLALCPCQVCHFAMEPASVQASLRSCDDSRASKAAPPAQVRLLPSRNHAPHLPAEDPKHAAIGDSDNTIEHLRCAHVKLCIISCVCVMIR